MRCEGRAMEYPSIFQDDTLLPAQWTALFSSYNPTPEHRLMLAVLLDAVNIITSSGATVPGNGRTGRELVSRRRTLLAETWMWVRNDDDSLFSFRGICQQLDIEYQWLRAGLKAATSYGRIRVRHSIVSGSRKVASPAQHGRKRGHFGGRNEGNGKWTAVRGCAHSSTAGSAASESAGSVGIGAGHQDSATRGGLG